MRLVDDHTAVRCQIWLGQELAQQHAVGHVLEDGLVAGHIYTTQSAHVTSMTCTELTFEANGVAHFLAKPNAHLLRHSRSD